MPGNQGGSNWGTTAADPQKGMVFVVGVNQVAILKLEDVTEAHGVGAGAEAAAAAARAAGRLRRRTSNTARRATAQICSGALPGVPSLVGVTDRMGEDAIKAVVTGGQGHMRPVSSITNGR